MSLIFHPNMLRAYFICGTQDVPDYQLDAIVSEAIKAGITAFQYRDKGNSRLSSEQRLDLGQTLREKCRAVGIPFIVDDDIELAKALDADGIHVGQSDQRVEQVIAEVGDRMFVGLSCSTLAEVDQANLLDGIAYLGSGPVFPTQSKADADPVIGLDGLTDLVDDSKVPIVAIGGITEANLKQVAQTGAAGVSVISMLTQSSDMDQTVQRMLAAFPEDESYKLSE
ncbi:thiamine phosphate synthase [Levilactobacillus bambusae]|uniref:Thiamine-phosphate synthase n=1 Tax=Levilactobacillus bambusae TaxID=2024736 RepID=A0A2V1N098_9LACO|nr:thiamine phosphate synthase [Levilactobacillus bambusae]PWF99769.1 thiamine phosphate synthase [Levilactobacillus bambusae]